MSRDGMSRRDFLTKAGAASAALMLSRAPWVFAAGDAPRPNILFLISDDHGKVDLGCYGNRHVKTPNLDAFAAQGTTFERAFTVTAVCTPSRTCFYTSLYPHQSGSFGFERMKRGVKVIPEYLKPAGYRTGCIGKLHLMPDKSKLFDTYVDVKKLGFGRDVEGYAREVKQFLAGPTDKPFFLQVGFSDPHRPFPTPGVKTGKKAEVSNPHDPADVYIPPMLADIPPVRKEMAQYYDAIHRLDRGVGLILKALEDAGLAKNTLVIYAGDHGGAFPFSKTTLYDGGLNVPFIARWPGKLAAGARTNAMVHFVDLLPTFLDLAGAKIPEHLEGKSFAPVLTRGAAKHRDVVFGSHTTHFYHPSCPSRSIREDQYHYIYNLAAGNEFRSDSLVGITYTAMAKAAAGGKNPDLTRRLKRLKYRPREELYDVLADPFELRNLADDPKFAGEMTRLHQRLAAFMKDIDDPWLPVMREQHKREA